MVLLCVVLTDWGNVFGGDTTDVPEQTIDWPAGGSGWKLRSRGSNSVFSISVSHPVLHTWRWTDDTMKTINNVPVGEGILSFAPLRCDIWLVSCYYESDDHVDFCIGSLKSGNVVDSWPQPTGWYAELGRASHNGAHVAAWSVPRPAKTGTREPVRFGLVALKEKEFDWSAAIIAPSGTAEGSIKSLVPTEDGRHIGVAGWDNGIAMIDTVKKKVTWVASPLNKPEMRDSTHIDKVPWSELALDEISTRDIAFTPDSKLVYAGGDEAAVFGIDVLTGAIVSRWEVIATLADPGTITNISVSPDGRFVAAGTGPEGQVYLFSTKDGKRHILNHGGSTILITSFSPDSKRLASFAAGKIKIWKLPEEEAESKPDKTRATKEAAK